jgi:hypothetical protein
VSAQPDGHAPDRWRVQSFVKSLIISQLIMHAEKNGEMVVGLVRQRYLFDHGQELACWLEEYPLSLQPHEDDDDKNWL